MEFTTLEKIWTYFSQIKLNVGPNLQNRGPNVEPVQL